MRVCCCSLTQRVRRGGAEGGWGENAVVVDFDYRSPPQPLLLNLILTPRQSRRHFRLHGPFPHPPSAGPSATDLVRSAMPFPVPFLSETREKVMC